jgi:hypothetical protein
MSHFSARTNEHGSLKHTEGEFSIAAWAVLSSVLFAVVVLVFVIL